MSDYSKACQEFEKALNDMANTYSDDSPKMVTEFVVFTASSYMEDEQLNSVTSYNWFCTNGMSQSHLVGLIQVGTEAVRSQLEER